MLVQRVHGRFLVREEVAQMKIVRTWFFKMTSAADTLNGIVSLSQLSVISVTNSTCAQMMVDHGM